LAKGIGRDLRLAITLNAPKKQSISSKPHQLSLADDLNKLAELEERKVTSDSEFLQAKQCMIKKMCA
jgi:hypothetical protein